MKTPILSLTRVLSLVVSLFVLVSCSNDLYGQNISRKVAIKTAKSHRAEAGFQKLNFSKNSLNNILKSPAVAIKLYNGLPNGGRGSAVLMTIGLDASGKEIGAVYTQVNASGVTTSLSRTVKDIQITNAKLDRRITSFSTSFGKEDLLALLNATGVDGIDFMPTKKADDSGNQVLTLTASPTGNSPEVETLQSFMSPCPPECFDGEEN